MNNTLEKLWSDGFVKIDQAVPASDLIRINESIKRLLHEGQVDWNFKKSYEANYYMLPPFTNRDWTVLSNIAGRDRALDVALENFFNDFTISQVLKRVLGPDYLIWELSARVSNHNDSGLALHEDAKGELGISILLNDQPDNNGTTVFVKGSHRFPVSCRDSGVEEYLRPSFMSPFVTPAKGKAGDAFIFFKKTWHGRVKKGKGSPPSSALIFGLFPTGYNFTKFNIQAETLNSLPETLRLHLSSEQKNSASANRMMDDIYKSENYHHNYWKISPYIKKILDIGKKIVRPHLRF
jgi:putative 2OG-Fe(II) oxygenase